MGVWRAQEIRIDLPRTSDVIGEPAGAGNEANILLAANCLADTELSQPILLPDRRGFSLETCTIDAAGHLPQWVAEPPVSSACKLSNPRMSGAFIE
jgi:hypothetical protein